MHGTYVVINWNEALERVGPVPAGNCCEHDCTIHHRASHCAYMIAKTFALLTRPQVGLMPASPIPDAGMRTEPPMSDSSAPNPVRQPSPLRCHSRTLPSSASCPKGQRCAKGGSMFRVHTFSRVNFPDDYGASCLKTFNDGGTV